LRHCPWGDVPILTVPLQYVERESAGSTRPRQFEAERNDVTSHAPRHPTCSAPALEGSTRMGFIVLVLWWVIVTSLGIAAIVALEPLWTRRSTECPVDTPRSAPRRTRTRAVR
jgi:hypothetical protein